MLFVWAPQQMPEQDDDLQFGFNAFWLRYPNRTAKKDAQKAWTKLNPSRALQTKMFAAIEDQKRWRELGALRREWRPSWPYPATWLNNERWEDELPGLRGRMTLTGPCPQCGASEPCVDVKVCNANWLAREKAKRGA